VIRLAVLASGRGSNLQAIIDAVGRGELPVKLVLVLSDNPRAQALERARTAGIPTVVVRREDYRSRRDFNLEILRWLRRYQVDLVALAGYMRVLSPEVVRAYPNRIMNIHPSLLPAFPGLEAQRQALEYGVKVTGCTVHFVDEGVDTGPIIIQRAVPVREDDTAESLSGRILEQEHQIYPEAIRLFATGRLRVEGRRVRVLEEG